MQHTRTQLKALTQVSKANQCAERAYWWLKGIAPDTVAALGISEQIRRALTLLQTADDITLDILLTIKNTNK